MRSASLNQADKVARFRALHESPGTWIIANPWDGASARILAASGFKALATSSGAVAATLGRRDHQLSRDDVLAHCRTIVAATDLPVSADLENGFGDSPEQVAETIRLAASTGLVGGSIEDSTGREHAPLYSLDEAVDRVAAAVDAARGTPCGFVVTARAENFLHGKADLADTIRRLQAFERAGADVLFAPGLPDLAAVRTVCAAVSKPVNFMIGLAGRSFSVAELAACGVRRISLAASLYRAALSGLVAALREIREQGTFGYVESSLTSRELTTYLNP
jgi:2-methylisocitrate lyase-like PEP mutase family enzyme